MSNERIDLTEFEGIEDRIKHCQEGNYPAEDLLQELALIAPTLIAELKRCYEQLDAVKHEVENCSECGGHREEEGTFHYCQNYCRCEEFDASK